MAEVSQLTEPSGRHVRQRRWGLFAAWVVVGVAWSFTVLGIASIGLFILPVALAASIVLARKTTPGHHRLGVLSGLGEAPLYVAYLNRRGPGNICSATAHGQSCVQEWSPWPWVVIGFALVAAGVVAFWMARARQERRQLG